MEQFALTDQVKSMHQLQSQHRHLAFCSILCFSLAVLFSKESLSSEFLSSAKATINWSELEVTLIDTGFGLPEIFWSAESRSTVLYSEKNKRQNSVVENVDNSNDWSSNLKANLLPNVENIATADLLSVATEASAEIIENTRPETWGWGSASRIGIFSATETGKLIFRVPYTVNVVSNLNPAIIDIYFRVGELPDFSKCAIDKTCAAEKSVVLTSAGTSQENGFLSFEVEAGVQKNFSAVINSRSGTDINIPSIPIPGAVWLLGPALLGLLFFGKKSM